MMGSYELTTLIIGLAIAIGLFFLLRGLNLWYWRINEIISNQEEQINQMTRLLTKFEDSKEDLNQNNPRIVNPKAKNVTDMCKKKDNRITVKVKATGRIENWKIEDWEDVVKKGNEEKFELL